MKTATSLYRLDIKIKDGIITVGEEHKLHVDVIDFENGRKKIYIKNPFLIHVDLNGTAIDLYGDKYKGSMEIEMPETVKAADP